MMGHRLLNRQNHIFDPVGPPRYRTDCSFPPFEQHRCKCQAKLGDSRSSQQERNRISPNRAILAKQSIALLQ